MARRDAPPARQADGRAAELKRNRCRGPAEPHSNGEPPYPFIAFSSAKPSETQALLVTAVDRSG